MDFEKATEEVNAKEVSNILKKYKKEKGSVLPNVENIGLASDNLTQMISSAYFYEKNNLRNIINFLRN
jgi:carbamate kinase